MRTPSLTTPGSQEKTVVISDTDLIHSCLPLPFHQHIHSIPLLFPTTSCSYCLPSFSPSAPDSFFSSQDQSISEMSKSAPMPTSPPPPDTRLATIDPRIDRTVRVRVRSATQIHYRHYVSMLCRIISTKIFSTFVLDTVISDLCVFSVSTALGSKIDATARLRDERLIVSGGLARNAARDPHTTAATSTTEHDVSSNFWAGGGT